MKRLTALLMALFLICNVCYANVTVKMLDVGQGDALLIKTDTQTVLIDTSDLDERTKLRRELYKARAFVLDKVILTHPHADHAANAAFLIQDGVFKVRHIYDNGVVVASKFFSNYLQEAQKRGVKRDVLHAGQILDLGDGATLTVLYPFEHIPLGTDINNTSIVARLDYGNFSMLFTGDAEIPVEEKLTDLQPVNVLKAGHHGSKTSSSLPFLKKLKPEYVLISAGEPTTKRGGNTYGHPHVQALQRFLAAGVNRENILWTYQNGTITIDTDGDTYHVFTERTNDWLARRLLTD